MNKKNILFTLICVMSQFMIPGAGAISKIIPRTSKIPGILPSVGTLKPALSTPTIQLTPKQIETFTTDLSQIGGKQYLAEIQMIWETKPELIYNAQQAIQMADREAERNYMYKIQELAKELASKGPELFNVQDAIVHNPRLENFINQKLNPSLESMRIKLGDLSYKRLSNEPAGVKSLFYHLQNDVLEVIKKIDSILTDATLSPQQAAGKIRNLDSVLSDTINLAQNVADGAKSAAFKQQSTGIVQELESTQNNLQEISGILQKTAPGQKSNYSYNDIKAFAQSISESAQAPSSLQPSSPGELIPVPADIQPYIAAQMKDVQTMATQTIKDLAAFKKAIADLGLESQAKEKFMEPLREVVNGILVFSKLFNEIQALLADENGLIKISEKMFLLDLSSQEFINALLKIEKQIHGLLASEQEPILGLLQKIINEYKTMISHIRTSVLVAQEFQANKEIIADIKKNQNWGAVVFNTQKDLAQIKKSVQEIQQILSSDSKVLKTDKAPMGMLQVLARALEKYEQTVDSIKTINNVQDLLKLETDCKQQIEQITTILDSLFSKLAWLPTSTTKNQALDAFRKLKAEFLDSKRSLNTIFKEAGKLQEQHVFVNIRKNEIETGVMTILNKTTALRNSIIKDFPESKMNVQQHQALSNLEQKIADMRQALQKIKNAQTSFELEQLSKLYFNPSKNVAFPPLLSLPAGTPKWEETIKETLKLFGLKIVLGVTATGILTWITQPDKMSEDSLPYQIWYEWDRPNRIKAWDLAYEQGDIHGPKTEEEFKKESKKVLKLVDNLDQVPNNQLGAAVKDLDFSLNILNLKAFKQSALEFLKSIDQKIGEYALAADPVRAIELQHFRQQLKAREKEINKFVNQPVNNRIPSRNDFKSEYQQAIDLLKKYIKS